MVHGTSIRLSLVAVLFGSLIGPVAAAVPDAAALYGKHCASCHGADRLGAVGPALLPESLQRSPKGTAAGVIAAGRPATRMPSFQQTLTPEEITSLVEYIYAAPATPPVWSEAQINASRAVYKPESVEGNATTVKPVYDADPLNLFLVVEAGDHHVTVLDGDKLEPIFRFKSRYALHGGPKFSSDGRFVYFASRDGWISKFDMYRLETVVEVRAGINTRNVAVSADDRYVLVGNYLPQNLVLLDARDLSLIRVIPATDASGKGSRVSAVYTAPPRRSFIVALKDIRVVWEISYADHPAPVFGGLMHDNRLGKGLAEPGRFPVRRIKLDDYLDDFFFDQSYEHLIGASRDGNKGQVVDLIVGHKIADVDLPGLPHLGSGITWPWNGTTVLATPNLREGVVSIIDTANWKTVKKIPTLGPGFFMRSHENSRFAWVDVFSGPDKDAMQVIDKQTLEIVRTLRPAPGKTSAHVEFTRDGKYALVSIWENDGAVVVYDAATLVEVKRLPMNKPVGKYNVYNKIHYAEGTSH